MALIVYVTKKETDMGEKNMDFIQLMNATEYDFLRNNQRLGNRIILMGLGGSYAYGTNLYALLCATEGL